MNHKSFRVNCTGRLKKVEVADFRFYFLVNLLTLRCVSYQMAVIQGGATIMS